MKVPQSEKTQKRIRENLSATMQPDEIEEAMLLINEIEQLKKEKNAVVLGHNYMTPDVFYGVSDYVGDSLGLSYDVKDTDADIILFNGVNFMAETAKIMAPHKKVLIADKEAGCSLAESITAKDVIEMKKKYPGRPVVVYVNCTAEVKAEVDICCTSANADKVVNSLDADEVIFLPDQYLAANMEKKTDKKIIKWNGACTVHELYKEEDIFLAKKHFPELTVITHPECTPEVVKHADFNGSTSQMSKYIRDSGAKNILLLTECSMGDNLKAEFPDRTFVSTCQTCPYMKKITLLKVKEALLQEKEEIFLSEDIIKRARKSVDAMLAVGR